MTKICEFENCKKQAYYASTFNKPTRCKEHKLDKQKIRYSICMCGKYTPNYGLENDKKPSCCSECKSDNMNNLNRKKCFCGKVIPTYGIDKATHCKECKRDNMIDINNKNKICFCKKFRATFGINGKKVTHCKECKSIDMVDINNKDKMCFCKKSQARFGLENGKATHCNECKTDEMINVIDKLCFCGKARPIFGLINGIKTHCKDCRTIDMIDVTHKKCFCGKSRAGYGLENGKATHCQECQTTDMFEVAHLKCKSNYLDEDRKFICTQRENKKYKGYCCNCYAYHFPNDPLTFQIRAKTKEIAVRDYINANFEGFHHDKPLWISECECIHRRRIDHRKLIGNTLLCIETDENQHKYYDKNNEKVRYDDLMMIHGGKFIFIRFNPDKYKQNNKNVNPIISTRLVKIQDEINKQIKRIENEENTEILEEIFMYYDS